MILKTITFLKTTMTMIINLKDRRLQAIATRTLDKHFKQTYSELDLNRYTEFLIKETVRECMKQIAMPINMDDYSTMLIVEKQWEYLIKRFGVMQ